MILGSISLLSKKYYPDYSIKKTFSRIDENNEFFGVELLLYKEDGSLVTEGEKVCRILRFIFNFQFFSSTLLQRTRLFFHIL